MKRSFLHALAILLLILIVVFFLRSYIQDKLVALAVHKLEDVLEEPIHLGDISINPLSLEVDLVDLRIGGQEPVASLERAGIRFAWNTSTKFIHIEHIELDRPVVAVDLDDGRLVRLRGIQRRLDAAKHASEKDENKEADLQFAVDRLQVNDGRLTLSDPKKDQRLDVKAVFLKTAIDPRGPRDLHLDIGPTVFKVAHREEHLQHILLDADFSSTPAHIDLLAIQARDADLQASGTLDLDPADLKNPAVELQTDVRLNLGALDHWLPKGPNLSGTVTFSGHVSYRDAFRAIGNLTFGEAAIDHYRLGEGWARIDVTPEEIEAEAIHLDRPGGSIDARASLSLDDQRAIRVSASLDRVDLAPLLDDASLGNAPIDMKVTGELSLQGTLRNPLEIEGQTRIATPYFIYTSGPAAQASLEDRIMTTPPLDFQTSFRLDSSALYVDEAELKTARSTIYLEGRIGFDRRLDVNFDAVALALSDVSPLAGLDVAGNGWAHGSIRGAFSNMIVRAKANLSGARFDRWPLGLVEGTFVVPFDGARWLGNMKKTVGSHDEPAGDAEYYPERSLRLLANFESLYGARAFARTGPAVLMLPDVRTTIGRTTINGQIGVAFGSPLMLFMDLSLPEEGRAPPARLADLLFAAGVDLEGAPLDGDVFGQAVINGPLDALNGNGAFTIDALDAYGQYIDRADIMLALDDGDVKIHRADFRPLEGSLTLTGTLNAEGNVNAEVSLRAFPLHGLYALTDRDLDGILEASLTLAGSTTHPDLSGALRLLNPSYRNQPLGDARIDVHTEGNTLSLKGHVLGHQGEIDATFGLDADLPYRAHLKLGAVRLDPFLALGVQEGTQDEKTRIEISGETQVRGTLKGSGSTALDARVDSFVFSRGGLTLVNEGPIPIEWKRGRFMLKRTTLVGNATRIGAQGVIGAGGEVGFDIGGSVNLGLVAFLVPGVFQRLEGRMRLEGLETDSPFHVGGTLSALAFHGRALIEDTALRTEFFPPTFDGLKAEIECGDNNEVRITSLDGFLGGGRVSGGGLLILGPDYVPAHYDLHLGATDAWLRYPSFLPPGLVDLDLKFQGDVGRLLLSGDVLIKRMVYRERYNWERVLTDFRTYHLEDVAPTVESPPYFDIDLNVKAPGTFFIRNNLGNIQLRGDLKVEGDTNVIELYGLVESDRGTVTVLDNDFDLTRARIEFQGDYWDPLLDIRLQTEIDSYTVYYDVGGSLQDWTLTPGSDAGLSERDINSLIAFGTLADNITVGEAQALAAPTLEFLVGRFGSGFLQPIQALTRLDRFSVVPATDDSGNLGVRLYGEKELVDNKLELSGYYDVATDGNQTFQSDLEWRAFDCCSIVFRLESERFISTAPINPGLRLKLKLEYE